MEVHEAIYKDSMAICECEDAANAEYDAEMDRCCTDSEVTDRTACKETAFEVLSDALFTCHNPPPPEPNCFEIAENTYNEARANCAERDQQCLDDAENALALDKEVCECKAEKYFEYEEELKNCEVHIMIVDFDKNACKESLDEKLAAALEECENPTPPPEPTCKEIAETARV